MPNHGVLELDFTVWLPPLSCQTWSCRKSPTARRISTYRFWPVSLLLPDIARFYRDYVRLVDAVDTAAPGGILKLRYEALVDDVEGQTRRILDFLGLEFEPACLDFHLASEAVATPSSEQVRRPINRDSIGSAQPYREWLGPMIEELGDLADA